MSNLTFLIQQDHQKSIIFVEPITRKVALSVNWDDGIFSVNRNIIVGETRCLLDLGQIKYRIVR